MWCGATLRYRRLEGGGPSPERFAGRYVQRGLDISAEVTAAGEGLGLSIRSPIGALRAELRPIDRDLFLLSSPDEAALRPDRPWLAAVRFGADGFVLNSDRTKGLAFIRADGG